MEGFWGIIKCEMYYLSKFKDYDSQAAAIEELHIFLQLRTPTKEAKQTASDDLTSGFSKMPHKKLDSVLDEAQL
jgi:hypothetical protein